MLTKEEEDLIIFEIKFGDIILGDLTKEQLNQRISNEIFTKLTGTNESIGPAFIILPKEFITQEMCNIAFKKNMNLITEFPREFVTKEMYDSYLNYRKHYSNPYFTHLSKQRMGTISFTEGKCSRKEFSIKFITKEMWDKAIKSFSWLIRCFPKEMRKRYK